MCDSTLSRARSSAIRSLSDVSLAIGRSFVGTRWASTGPSFTAISAIYFLSELQHIPIVVVDSEFPHTVFEVFDRVANTCFVLYFQPHSVDIVGVEIKSPGKSYLRILGVLIWLCKHQ